MSNRTVFIHPDKDSGFIVNCGGTTMVITELRIRPMSNFTTPYELWGRGGSRLALTPRQMLEVLSEYARYTLPDPITFITGQVGYSFQVKKDGSPEDFALTRLTKDVGSDSKNQPAVD